MISNNAGGIIGGVQAPVNPNYLGSLYDFSAIGGATVPNLYNINPQTFPFYAMRNQFNNGIYTPGRPTFTPFNQNNPTAPSGIRMPDGQSLYSIGSSQNGWPNDPISQELLRRSYNPGGGGSSINTNPAAYPTRQAYNQAMRQYAIAEAAAGRPLMAYYDPRYSAPRRQIISNNVGGLLAT